MKIVFYGFRHSHIEGLYKRAISNSRVDVVACIEENKEAREDVANRLGIEFSCKSYEEYLNSDIDAVAIGGCYGDRGQAIIKALKAGKHVIADKPICTKREEFDEIVKLCKENNLKLFVMFDLRYIPASKVAKKIFDENKLGRVINVSFLGQHFLDYGKRPSWYFEDGKHGGTLNDLSIHGVDLIRHLTGQGIEKVESARVFNAYATEVKNFKDCGLFMAKLSGGGEVIADTSYSSSVAVYATDIYWNFKFWCEKGMLTFNFKGDEVTIYYIDKAEPEVIKCEDDGINYLDDFVDEINLGNSDITSGMLASCLDTLIIQEVADNNN